MASGLTAAHEGVLRPPAGRALVFVGFMGAGKTTAARRLARRFGLEVVDADATIAGRATGSAPEVDALLVGLDRGDDVVDVVAAELLAIAARQS